MGFVDAWSKSTGRHHWVPEHFFDQSELCRDLTQERPSGDVEPAPEPEAAESDQPSESWTVKRLEAYAAHPDRNYDLGGATRKGDILAAIRDADKAAQPDNPALTAIGVAHPGPGGETSTQDADASDRAPADISPTQTPATGENQE